MKSILQMDRENQLDRERRLLFCWCYTEAAKTFQPSEFGYRHDRFQMLYETLRIFLSRTVKVYYSHHCYIPNAVAVQTFFGLPMAGSFRQNCGDSTSRRKCVHTFLFPFSTVWHSRHGKKYCTITAFGRTMLTRGSLPQSRQQHRKSSGSFPHCPSDFKRQHRYIPQEQTLPSAFLLLLTFSMHALGAALLPSVKFCLLN